jgi:hypothetical protein
MKKIKLDIFGIIRDDVDKSGEVDSRHMNGLPTVHLRDSGTAGADST